MVAFSKVGINSQDVWVTFLRNFITKLFKIALSGRVMILCNSFAVVIVFENPWDCEKMSSVQNAQLIFRIKSTLLFFLLFSSECIFQKLPHFICLICNSFRWCGASKQCDQKNHQMSIKVAQNDLTRKMIDIDTFTKYAWEYGRFGQNNCCQRL